MENKNNEKFNNQTLTLINRQSLTITGITKVISIKTDIIQLDSNNGGIIILGNNLELKKFDNDNSMAEINGLINNIKYLQGKEKESLFRKIFK